MDERQRRRIVSEAAREEWDRMEAAPSVSSKPLAGGASSQVSGSPGGRKGLDVSSRRGQVGQRPVDVAMAAEFLIGALEGVDAIGEFRDELQHIINAAGATTEPGHPAAAEAVRVLWVWRTLDLLAEAVQAHHEMKAG